MKKQIIKSFKKLLPKEIVLLNAPLKNYCSFKIGGEASVMLFPRDLEEIIKIITICEEHEVVPFVMGKGTNLLIDDDGYEGVIINLKGWFEKVAVKGEYVLAGGGAALSKLIAVAHEQDLLGLTDGFGIPGSVGGAVFMNASAYSFEMGKRVSSVLALEDGKIKLFNHEQCEFEYRNSVFQKNGAIILQVECKLEKSKEKLNHREMVAGVMQKRLSSQPLDKPNAGSVFKRCGDVPVGKLVDELGLKGYTIGGAKISEKHANFIVNEGGATAKDVLALISFMREKVKEKYGLHIENEIRYLKN